MGELYDGKKMQDAIAAFEAAGLSTMEALLASHAIAASARKRFRSEAASLKAGLGPEKSAELARSELNDIISDLQDAIGPMVRTYNALLRDADDEQPAGS